MRVHASARAPGEKTQGGERRSGHSGGRKAHTRNGSVVQEVPGPLRSARRRKNVELNCAPYLRPSSEKRPKEKKCVQPSPLGKTDRGEKQCAWNTVPEHACRFGGRKTHTRKGFLLHEVTGRSRSGGRKNNSDLNCPPCLKHDGAPGRGAPGS